MASDVTVKDAARKAVDSAEVLRVVNVIFLTLTLIGAAILAFFGFTAEEDTGGIYLILLALATVIAAVPLFVLMRTVAAGTHLAGVQALEGGRKEGSGNTSVSTPISAGPRTTPGAMRCPTCGSTNMSGTRCAACGARRR